MEKTRENEEGRPVWMNFKSGITINSLLASFYSLLVLTPAAIYLELVTGQGRISTSLFVMLLWIEFARLAGKRLTKQEAYIIRLFAVTASVPLAMVFNVWYQNSDIAKMFNIGPYIPEWAVPPMETNVFSLRTFFHPSWILPIAVAIISSFFGLIADLGLSLFARELCIEELRLPFPMEYVDAETVITITEASRSEKGLLSIAALIGFLWSSILYVVPSIFQAWTGRYIRVVPIPWIDLTGYLEPWFPGATFGIATDLSGIIAGLVMPFPIIVGTFIGSMAKYFFGNWLSVIFRLTPDTNLSLPGYQGWWIPGMNINMIMSYSTLYFWGSIDIGLGFAVAFAPILGHPSLYASIFRRIFRIRGESRRSEERIIEPFSFYKVILPMMLVGIGGGALLFYILVPDFVHRYPWIMFFILFSPIITTIISAYMMGIAGRRVDPLGPFQNLLYYYARVEYGKVDVWFAPNPMSVRQSWVDELKVCQLTETKASSFVKMKLLLFPISLIIGYLYMEFFWRLAPIPSSFYPAAAAYWPIQAISRSIWIRGTEVGLFRVPWIIGSFAGATAVYLALDLLHCPIPYIAIAAGLSTWTPVAFTSLIGGIIATLIRRITGDAWWHRNRRRLAAGLAVGEGVALAVSVSISMVINSIWTSPI